MDHETQAIRQGRFRRASRARNTLLRNASGPTPLEGASPFKAGDLAGTSIDGGRPVFVKPAPPRRRNQKATLAIRSAADGTLTAYTQEFILTDVQQEDGDKYQLDETFGDWALTTFGRSPTFMTCSGVLLNGKGEDGYGINQNWAQAFASLYKEQIQADLGRLKNTVVLLFDGRMITGIILKMSRRQNSNPDVMISFSWVMLVISEQAIREDTS